MGGHGGPPDPDGFTAYCNFNATNVTTGGENYWASCQYGPTTAPIAVVNLFGSANGIPHVWSFDWSLCTIPGITFTCDENEGGLFRMSNFNSGTQTLFSTIVVNSCTMLVTSPGSPVPCKVESAHSEVGYPPYPEHWWPGGGEGNTVPAGQLYGDCLGGSHGRCPGALVAEPVNTATGSYFTSSTDLRLPGIGIPFEFSRSYNSADPSTGVMGRGWTNSYAVSLDITPTFSLLRAEDGQQLGFTQQPDATFRAAAGVTDGLVLLGDGTYKLTRRDQVVYRFDAAGRLTSLKDRNDQGLTFSYTAGYLTQITDSVGRQITLTITADKLTQVTLPDGRHVDYAYTNGLLTSVTDARGGTTTYTYDSGDLLATITDQNNHVIVSNVYGPDERISQQTDGRGYASTFAWDPLTETSTFTDARGKIWRDVYAKGHLMQRIDPLGNTTSYTYDTALNVTSVTDPRGFTTSFTYDPAGNMLTKTDPAPLSYQTVYTYNARNDVASVQDARGNSTTYSYDAAGNLTSITQPGSIVTQFGRDPAGSGLLTSLTDPRNKTTLFGYTSGNLTSMTDPLGNLTTMGYDGSGRMTSRVDPRGNVAGQNSCRLHVDVHLRQRRSPAHRRPTRSPTQQATSSTQRGTSRRAPTPRARPSSWLYDNNRNLTTVTAPSSIVTSYAYDWNNNLTSRLDPNSRTWLYAYDDSNRLSSVTSPLTKVWSFGYDFSGNVVTKTLPSGSITFAHDQINRLTGITYSNAPTTPNATFGYDANSNRTSMTDGQGSVAYTYDALNRLTQAVRGTNTFTWSYDSASNLLLRRKWE